MYQDKTWLYHVMPRGKNQGLKYYIFVTYVLHVRYMDIYIYCCKKKRRSVRQLIIIFKIYNLRLQTFKKFLYR